MHETDAIARAYLDTLRTHSFKPPAGFAPKALTLDEAYGVQD